MRSFRVYHERGGYIHVFAKDKDDAIEKYYEALESTLGHALKICSCYDRHPIDLVRPLRVEEFEFKFTVPKVS